MTDTNPATPQDAAPEGVVVDYEAVFHGVMGWAKDNDETGNLYAHISRLVRIHTHPAPAAEPEKESPDESL